MRRKRYNKYVYMILLLGTFVYMAVGYSILTQIVKIEGTASISSTWNILFTKIEEKRMHLATTKTPPIITDGTKATIDVELDEPGSQAVYEVTVANRGTLDAVVKDIKGVKEVNEKAPKAIQFYINGIVVGDSLNVNQEKTFEVVVTWNKEIESTSEISKEISFTIDFGQKASENVERPSMSIPTYTMDIDNTLWSREKNVTIHYPEGEGYSYQYSLDEGLTWKITPSKEYTVKFEKEGSIIGRVSDGKSSLTGELQRVVNIERNVPEAVVNGNTDAWSTSKTLTISAADKESGLASSPYSFDGGSTWQKENSKIFTTNQTVNIWVKDKAGNIIKQTILISKIDTLAPSNVILTKGSVTSSSITVTASATQSNMGIRGYQFSIDGGAYSTEQTSVSKTFTGLAKNTSHTFKVKVIGKNGKSTESSVITVSTNNITTPTYSVNSSADTWAQSKTVTITYPGTKTSNLVYEYSKDGGTTWTNVTSSSTTVTFTSNGSVIARIRDTGNSNNTVTGSTLTVTKIDTTKPSITGTKDITLAKGQSYNLLTGVTATDSESGVKSLTTSITNTTSLAVGTYTITYTAIDNASNQLTKTSTLQIVESTYNYGYTGTYKTFIVPYDGTYRFELWGAAGGGASGGHGAYTKGKIILTKGETLYIYVGQHREHQDVQAAYNGGGSSQPEKGIDGYENRYNSGGGATDIRLVSGAWDNFNSLKSRIMVASGGGGGFYRPGQTILGGAGGNLTGASGIKSTGEGSEKVTVATGGTQTSGGKGGIGEHTSGDAGSFGKGASVPSTKKFLAGGGGGYYGGGSSGVSTQIASTGGGGSSFISGFTGCNAIASNSTETNIIHTGQPNHYSGKVFEGILMYNGSQEMPNPRGSGTIIGNGNHGYARVTILSIQN